MASQEDADVNKSESYVVDKTSISSQNNRNVANKIQNGGVHNAFSTNQPSKQDNNTNHNSNHARAATTKVTATSATERSGAHAQNAASSPLASSTSSSSSSSSDSRTSDAVPTRSGGERGSEEMTHLHERRKIRMSQSCCGPPKESSSTNHANKNSLPKYLLLRHRMGYSTLKLSKRQRATYSWNDLEDFLLYKEQKYNSINILNRFIILLLLCLAVCIFCHAFSLSTTDWRGVRYLDYYRTIGLFVKCDETYFRQCTNRTSAYFERQIRDSVTNEVLCYADNSSNSKTINFVRNYTGAMWSMAVLSLLLDFIAVILLIIISIRPTRSHSLVVVMFALLFSTACQVIVCVLFPIYTRCESKVCQGRTSLSPEVRSTTPCAVSYLWGYKLYIGCAALHFLCFLFGFFMHNMIHNLRVGTRQQLREERQRRRQQRKMSTVNYVLEETLTPEERAALREQENKDKEENRHGRASYSYHQERSPPSSPIPPVNGRASGTNAQMKADKHAKKNKSKGKAASSDRENARAEYERNKRNHLTAEELGVRIEGASDWLYDEKSDMYFSFEQNCFWDPLTCEYYNCATGSWQEELGRVVEVRDVMDYTVKNYSFSAREEGEGEGENRRNQGHVRRGSEQAFEEEPEL